MKHSFGVFFLSSFFFPSPPPPLEKEKGVKFVTSELFFLPTLVVMALMMESWRSYILCR